MTALSKQAALQTSGNSPPTVPGDSWRTQPISACAGNSSLTDLAKSMVPPTPSPPTRSSPIACMMLANPQTVNPSVIGPLQRTTATRSRLTCATTVPATLSTSAPTSLADGPARPSRTAHEHEHIYSCQPAQRTLQSLELDQNNYLLPFEPQNSQSIL